MLRLAPYYRSVAVVMTLAIAAQLRQLSMREFARHIPLLSSVPASFTMAWRCSASSNAELANNLRRGGLLTSPRVFEAMVAVDRANYAPSSPYVDTPQSIGYGATISAPHMHAHALDLLEPFMQPGAKVLDVGCGSGYLVAVVGRLVGESGKVWGVDYLKELVDLARANIFKKDKDLLERGIAHLEVGDGWKGRPDDAPFDAIHVGAAASSSPPALEEQLKNGGRMIIPVGPEWGEQFLMVVDKNEDGSISRKRLMGVRYVPLVKQN